MNNGDLFCHLSSTRIAALIRAAKGTVCSAGPRIQPEPAKAMAEVAARNALRLSPDQVAEALARLSPAAKAIAIAQTDDP